MTTTIPSGLGATLGVAEETAFGTEATVSRWFNFDNESLAYKKITTQSKGVRGGLYELAGRRAVVGHTAAGKIKMDLVDKGLGLILKHMLGSSATATQQGATPAYLQTHTPGDTLGKSLTFQKGVPQTDGTVQAFTYPGAKITDWQISVAQGQLAALEFGVDAVNEDPAGVYAAPSLVAANPFNFVQGALLTGGTVTTTGGVATVAGGAAPAGVVKSATVKGTNGLKTDRFSLGSATKKEQLSNKFRTVAAEVEVEFAAMADFYTAMQSDSPLALQLNFQGALISGTYYAACNIVLPKCFIDDSAVAVPGLDVVMVKAPLTVLDDGADPVIQIQYTSTDVAV